MLYVHRPPIAPLMASKELTVFGKHPGLGFHLYVRMDGVLLLFGGDVILLLPFPTTPGNTVLCKKIFYFVM